jgi:hypothetical protein
VNAALAYAMLLTAAAAPAGCAGALTAPPQTQSAEGAAFRTAAAGALSFSAAAYAVGESNSTLQITVSRSGGSAGQAGVAYATADGTALAGANYTKTAGTLNFAAGQTSAHFTVSIVNRRPFEGTRTFTLALSQPTGGATLGTSRATVAISSTSWVYYDGKFEWPGDYSYPNPGQNIFIDYADTAGRPLNGGRDISVTEAAGKWGAWQPYATGDDFDTRGYKGLHFALKATAAGQVWSCQFLYVGDVPVGISVNVTDYGPAPVPGKWTAYTIPLGKLGIANTDIYKFAIQDQTGLENNCWYVDDVGFVQ